MLGRKWNVQKINSCRFYHWQKNCNALKVSAILFVQVFFNRFPILCLTFLKYFDTLADCMYKFLIRSCHCGQIFIFIKVSHSKSTRKVLTKTSTPHQHFNWLLICTFGNLTLIPTSAKFHTRSNQDVSSRNVELLF